MTLHSPVPAESVPSAHGLRAVARLTGASIPLAVQRGLPAVAIIGITVLIAHRLPTAEVARWAVLAALISIARVTADFGLDRSLPRAMTNPEGRSAIAASGAIGRTITGVASGVGLFTVGCVLVGPGIDLLLASGIPIIQSPTVVAMSWSVVHSRTSALLVPAALNFGVSIAVAFATIPTLNLVGIMAGMAIGAAVEAAVAWQRVGVTASRTGASLICGLHALRDAVAFGIQGALGILYARIPVLVLAVVGPSLIVTFSLGYSLYAAIALASSALALTTFARLNAATAARSRPAFMVATRNFAASAALVVGAAFIIALFVEPLVRVVFTDSYVEAADVARILMLVVPVSICNGFLSVALFAVRADGLVVAFSVSAVAILACLTAASVPFGATGSALALLITESAIACVAGAVLIRRLERAF